MKPITFYAEAFIHQSAEDICAQIADTDKWADFTGYGPLPGIKEAKYEKRTKDMVGSRISVKNLDGSRHVEEIYKWDSGTGVGLKLMDFSFPLNRIADHFLEEWEFEPKANGTKVKRSFELYAKGPMRRPFLWLISLLFRRAIRVHLEQIANSAQLVES